MGLFGFFVSFIPNSITSVFPAQFAYLKVFFFAGICKNILNFNEIPFFMIDSNAFGEIVVDGKAHGDIKIDRNGGVEDWHCREHHTVTAEDIIGLIEGVDILVVGIGTMGAVGVADDAKKLAGEKGVKLVVKNTPEACGAYNSLLEKNPGKVAAIMHSTC
jgi:hypothetical protein